MAARPAIVVLNAGSSSIKFCFYEEGGTDLVPFLKGQIEGLYTEAAHFIARTSDGEIVSENRWSGTTFDHERSMSHLFDFAPNHLSDHHIAAVGHRIVHGGAEFAAPLVLTRENLARLDELVPLAPLHQPHNLAPVRAIFDIAPDLLQLGCFDTAFHAGQPRLAQAFALPPTITERGVRRYGFHGLSYEYIASILQALDPGLERGRTIVAHLGNGASLCALDGGRSVASTTGFSAVEGLPMGTRSGSLDPGVILYLLDEMKMTSHEIEHLLYTQSGLLGVSGISSDMRTLETSQDPRAGFAIDLLVYRIGREIGSLAAALGGVDAIVFTAGIGEHSVRLRRAVCEGAAWLGVALDDDANARGARRISAHDSKVSVWVVPTDEELMIARHTRQATIGH